MSCCSGIINVFRRVCGCCTRQQQNDVLEMGYFGAGPPIIDGPLRARQGSWRWGRELDERQCVIEWNHNDGTEVGKSSVITIKLVCKNGSPYRFRRLDVFRCSIKSVEAGSEEMPHAVEPASLVGQSTIKVSFVIRISGEYRISLSINGNSLGMQEILRNYIPGHIDANKSVIIDKKAVMVVEKGVYTPLKIIPKDSFGNDVRIEQQDVKVETRKNGATGEEIDPELVVMQMDYGRYDLLVKMDGEGYYVCQIKVQDMRIGPPKLEIISLSETKLELVNRNLKATNLNVRYKGAISESSKEIYCCVYPWQIQVREYYLFNIFRRVLSTWKVSPVTRIILHPQPDHFTLDDGVQKSLALTSPDRDVLAATFHGLVLKNIGGSETFQSKQRFFYSKLREHYPDQIRSNTKLKIDICRRNLLESAMQATKSISHKDWCRKFSIFFDGEEGLDWGGVSREFFEQLCIQLFDAPNKLFTRFNNDNSQALVHPNYAKNRPSTFDKNYFTFAGRIVGKCLYESSHGSTLLVKARFTRSFLAQLLGARINYTYFESDDPDLYITKIQYILENDVTDLELVFAEEEFATNHQGPPTVKPLIKNGDKKAVTEQNKLDYLNALAHYRLTKRVMKEIEWFKKGLNEIVPDQLLCVFSDANELELLMCGMGEVSFDDLKVHTRVDGSNQGFLQVLSWFWVVVSEFTQEEMAKLLQFVTGCSQLPPGGFRELNPHFTITSSPITGMLPTAHTCFNKLCLPEYSSCEQFQTSLMTALNEGGEGFGMT